jgi:hypothetical protein
MLTQPTWQSSAAFTDVNDFVGSNGATVDRFWSSILSSGMQNGCASKRQQQLKNADMMFWVIVLNGR